MRELPWQVWELFRDRRVEVGLSEPEYKLPKIQTTLGRDRVRILAVLGNSEGIDIEFDRQEVQGLENRGAELEFLQQPTKQKLLETLWQNRGWQIFFFAGHSETEEESGKIALNRTEHLTIEELRNSLTGAIAHGLQLAIFNSCDGLGLAHQLAKLHLPQSIVMRQPIPDAVAKDFLRHFLTLFASGLELYTTMRETRLKLEDTWDKKYPGASWLPTICQNPAVMPPTWSGLLPPPSWQLQRTIREHSDVVECLAIAPDGKTLASGSYDRTIKLWNLETGELQTTLKGHTSALLSLAFSPDGKTLASSSNMEFQDASIKIWDLQRGSVKQNLGKSWLALRAASVAFSPDGQHLASGHLGFTALDTAIYLWHLPSGKVKSTLKGHGWEVHSVAFTPDGQKLVSGGIDGAIMTWNWRGEKREQTLKGAEDWLQGFRGWFDTTVGFIWDLAISPDGEAIASADTGQKLIQIWNLKTGKLLRTVTQPEGYPLAVTFSPDGETLASGGKDNRVRLWNYRSGELLQTLEHFGPVKAVVFSPDGKTLVSGSEDQTVKIWRLWP
jgi:WD40 repeat protein